MQIERYTNSLISSSSSSCYWQWIQFFVCWRMNSFGKRSTRPWPFLSTQFRHSIHSGTHRATAWLPTNCDITLLVQIQGIPTLSNNGIDEISRSVTFGTRCFNRRKSMKFSEIANAVTCTGNNQTHNWWNNRFCIRRSIDSKGQCSTSQKMSTPSSGWTCSKPQNSTQIHLS